MRSPHGDLLPPALVPSELEERKERREEGRKGGGEEGQEAGSRIREGPLPSLGSSRLDGIRHIVEEDSPLSIYRFTLQTLPEITCHQLSGNTMIQSRDMAWACLLPVSPLSSPHSSFYLLSSQGKCPVSRFSEDELVCSQVHTPERIPVQRTAHSQGRCLQSLLWLPLQELPGSPALDCNVNCTIGILHAAVRDSEHSGLCRQRVNSSAISFLCK